MRHGAGRAARALRPRRRRGTAHGRGGLPRRLRGALALLPGGSLPQPLRALLAGLAVALATGWGFAALALHLHALGTPTRDAGPGPLGRLLADGSSPLTLWPGWAAALTISAAALRLRRSAVEPPPRRRGAPDPGASELRSGLRREYLWTRWVLLGVAELALADCCRLAVSGGAQLAGVHGAGDGLAWMAGEAAGLVTAAAALAAWVAAFRAQLERVGALPPGRPGTDVASGRPERTE